MEILNKHKHRQEDPIGVLSKRSKPSSFKFLAVSGMMFQNTALPKTHVWHLDNFPQKTTYAAKV